ncbi:MAG: hydroxypyruvate isomerase [Dissulfurispiraceae bacterium]|jgi:hydroxypyruvate isomerase
MPKFAANLTMLFTEAPFMQRFTLAKEAGFKTVEYLFPYDYDLIELKAQLQVNGLKQILFNLPAGNWGIGERGIAAHPERIKDFRVGISKAIEYAEGLGVSQLNCLAGKKASQYSDEQQWVVLVENVRYAAEALHQKGLRLLIESINHFDIPGFLLNRTDKVLKLIDAVGMPNVFMQYDVYHVQREEGELTATLRNNIGKIAHIQVADNPGRHQPGSGEINYPFLFREIDALNYQGYIGLEYIPDPDTRSSFEWISTYGYML